MSNPSGQSSYVLIEERHVETLRPFLPSIETWRAMTHDERCRLLAKVVAWNQLCVRLEQLAGNGKP
jgi:hypothetical protein